MLSIQGKEDARDARVSWEPVNASNWARAAIAAWNLDRGLAFTPIYQREGLPEVAFRLLYTG
jgi:hypothetical protein